jgi:hypothetical protein
MAQRAISIVIEVDGAKDAASQVRQVRSALDDLGGGAEGLKRVAQQSRDVTQAMKELGSTFDLSGRQREMAANLEGLFRRITDGARSAADVFKNIWREVADHFERQLRQMAAAAAVSFGGGALFTGGGGLLSGLGGTVAGTPTLASVLGLPATTPVGDVLSQLNGIGPLSGGQAALGGLGLFGLSMGAGSPVLRGLGSIAGGALTGFSVGGPVGAVIGGIVGGIASLFGKDKKKEHDADIANQGFAQLRQILDDYYHFRRDFASSVDAANRIWSEMAAAWVRPQSSPSQRPYFDEIIRAIQNTEDERNRRRQMLSEMPIPEFERGGFVSGIGARGSGFGRGEVPAILHAGEFVVNRRAVDRWGVSVLEGLNEGRGTGSGGGMSISIDPDGAAWLEQNSAALEKGIAVILRRGGAVSRALRQ